MINIAGKLISNKVNNIRFFLNYPKIDIEEENDHVQKFVEVVNKSIKKWGRYFWGDSNKYLFWGEYYRKCKRNIWVSNRI